MRWLAYMISRFLLKLILGVVVKTHVLHRERSRLPGGWLFVSNHISHFDPPFLTVAAFRKLDWMATRELYHPWPVALWMKAVDTFPVDRERADRAATRETLERVKRGRVVGIFPEGGIRDGANSVLEGASLKPGLAGLAQLSGAPVVPCALIGSDQLYTHRNWIPFRKSEAWIAFGEPLYVEGEGKEARAAFEERIAAALRALYAELKERFALTEKDLPQPPARRKGRL
ncbi:MAG: lysophospholipid acyltransferase family protein [Chthoniobacter sp.]|uniref:lysophospholipid acyltransferase family protein n=1 Tax=Chthoniobacter sp. TaxID=2510640 RepID=UPI0032A26F86